MAFSGNQGTRGARAKRAITIIGTKPEDIFELWREPEKRARQLSESGSTDVHDSRPFYLSGVFLPTALQPGHTPDAPGRACAGAQSTVTEQRENKSIAWRTTDGQCDYEGLLSVEPAPDVQGAKVTLEIASSSSQGLLARGLGVFSGRTPEEQVMRILRGLKQLVETGEVATNRGPTGKPAGSMAGLPKPDGRTLALAGLGVGLLAGLAVRMSSARSFSGRR